MSPFESLKSPKGVCESTRCPIPGDLNFYLSVCLSLVSQHNVRTPFITCGLPYSSENDCTYYKKV
jgi:hypothetical protein